MLRTVVLHKSVWGLCWLLCLATSLPGQEDKKVSEVTSDSDPYQWLEDVTGEKALEWVRARNAKTQTKFEADPNFNKTAR